MGCLSYIIILQEMLDLVNFAIFFDIIAKELTVSYG